MTLRPQNILIGYVEYVRHRVYAAFFDCVTNRLFPHVHMHATPYCGTLVARVNPQRVQFLR